MIVAFTGAASFLGQNLIGLFEEDAKVSRIVALDVHPPQTAAAKTRHYDLDLTKPTADERMAQVLAEEGAEVLVHLAFLSGPAHAVAWAHELEAVGTMHAMTAARQANVRKVVLFSQTLLYGAQPTNPNFLTEKHQLRARSRERFFADKIEAEHDTRRFGEAPDKVATILRVAPILGPTITNYVTRYLSHRVVPTLMGFDPLWQLVHEVDAVAAFKIAIFRDCPGTYNIVGDGVLPLSTVIRLAGRIALPLPTPVASAALSALWAAEVGHAPPSFLDYLRYVCVADGELAATKMGFRPAYSTREALLDYANAQHLRDLWLEKRA